MGAASPVPGALRSTLNDRFPQGFYKHAYICFIVFSSVSKVFQAFQYSPYLSGCWSEVSASNAITSSSYLLLAGGVESTTWKLRGVAIAAAGFAVGLHTIAPRAGRGLQDLLSAVKLFTLLFIVCTGFAALAGHRRVPDPHNFDIHTSFKGTSNSGYNIGTALLDAIFSFQGYDNVNAV